MSVLVLIRPVSRNFWNILLHCSRASSNPWIILEWASTPILIIVAGPPSKGFLLYDFDVSFR